uniref:Uncharacterized protein n=1 Tax=Cacopsylla melanoneura TaxID=428564 RepID=A0A8D9B7T8_9HEMI
MNGSGRGSRMGGGALSTSTTGTGSSGSVAMEMQLDLLPMLKRLLDLARARTLLALNRQCEEIGVSVETLLARILDSPVTSVQMLPPRLLFPGSSVAMLLALLFAWLEEGGMSVLTLLARLLG